MDGIQEEIKHTPKTEYGHDRMKNLVAIKAELNRRIANTSLVPDTVVYYVSVSNSVRQKEEEAKKNQVAFWPDYVDMKGKGASRFVHCHGEAAGEFEEWMVANGMAFQEEDQ